MRKISKLTLLTALLVLALSTAAFAASGVEYKSADWAFGDKKDVWGLVYLLEYDEEGKFEKEGHLMPFFKIYDEGTESAKKPARWHITFTGPYIQDGRSLTTKFGIRLGVNFSPYIAKFDSKNKVLGLTLDTFDYSLGPVDLAVKFAWMFPHVWPGGTWGAPAGYTSAPGPRANDILVDVAAKIDVLKLDLALNRYSVPQPEDAETLYNYYHNVAVEAELADVVPGLKLNGVYAFYQQDKDWLYEVKGEYKVSDSLKVWAGHRNSKFWADYEAEVEGDWKKVSVTGGPDTHKEQAYVGEGKPIDELWKRNNSIDVGLEYSFDLDPVTGKLTTSYDTTNKKHREDFDDVIAVGLDAEAFDFTLNQQLNVVIADDKTTDGARQVSPYEDTSKPRIDYALDFYTPEYALPVGFADAFVKGIVNFDWDRNFAAESRYHLIGAVEVGFKADIWRLPGVYLGGKFAYDMPSDKEKIENPFKFAVVAKYDAPNKVGFRLEYLSSRDYKNTGKFVRDQAINDRYNDIRYYDNSKFHGIRLSINFPLN